MNPRDASASVKALAREVGFDLAGIARAGPIGRGDYYRTWIDAGRHGTMAYLARNAEARANPAELFPGARSIVCVALNYRRLDEPPALERSATGRVAQHARGEDYHVVMRRMLETMLVQLRARIATPFDARLFVDTGPLIEREWAMAAGLGWIGKNTCVLNERVGSFTFLGEVVTTLDLAPDEPATDHCGTCTRCLDACPTAAFPAPYEMDARRCISYLTIEHRGEVAAEFHAAMGDWVYGCDVCQDVCPYNSRATTATNAAVLADRIPARIDPAALTRQSDVEIRDRFRGTAGVRATPDMWRRNAGIVLRNAAAASASPERTRRDSNPQPSVPKTDALSS